MAQSVSKVRRSIPKASAKPEYIVTNSDDYNKFAKKSAYLSSKILTMFLERPIIFLGYGINDWDISKILDSIADCLENDQLNQLSERLLFVERNSEPKKKDEISERRITTQGGKTISMKNILLTNYSHLYEAILVNEVKYDVKILRKIKSQLYELVKENKPTKKLYVVTNGKHEIQYDDMILKEAIPTLNNGRTIFPIRQIVSRCQTVKCINKNLEELMKKPAKIYCLFKIVIILKTKDIFLWKTLVIIIRCTI